MPRYRTELPQLSDQLFLTDGGIETTLIFHEGLDLPHFAAFHLLQDTHGIEVLNKYFHRYVDVARRHRTGFVLESATWRANPDWAALLGYSKTQLDAVNRRAINMLEAIREQHDDYEHPLVISGCIGPRGDGYDPGHCMTPDEAQDYHGRQISSFCETTADLVTAITMTNTPEAIGLARAAHASGMPCVLSFTVETDGRLPTGQALVEAIEEVDLETDNAPSYYMINCAHPTHFDHTLPGGDVRLERVRGLRGNASRLSHAELDECEELDDGDPSEFGKECAGLSRLLPNLNIVGGCCGTDHRHIEECARAIASG